MLVDHYEGQEAAIERRDVQARLGRLDGLERWVMELRFGLGDEGPMTQPDVANRLDVSKGRVQKAEARAVHQLARSGGRADHESSK